MTDNMRPIVAVICEYDPFHLGHAQQYKLIRSQLPDAYIICIMSGCFTQRGLPSLHLPSSRAKAALTFGADVVLELPVAYSVRDAEHFAHGAVSIANSLRCIDYLSFGLEGDIAPLRHAAHCLNSPTTQYTNTLKNALSKGISFAKAQGLALSETLSTSEHVFSTPNNILGISYLRAIERLNSPIKPLPVFRNGSYHSTDLSEVTFPSATAVRLAYLSGNPTKASDACGYTLPFSPICKPDALDSVLLYTIRNMSLESMRELPYCSEGLEYRLRNCSLQATSRENLLNLLKTKRYAHARLSRLCTHALLHLTQDDISKYPTAPYTRLIGFNKKSSELLKLFKNSEIPVYAKSTFADRANPIWNYDEKAYDLWALGSGLPASLIYTQKTVVINDE